MNSLIDDMGVLTSVPTSQIKDIVDVITDAISHSVYESVCKKDTQCEVDIGIGILYIKYEGDSIKYRFVPSPRLEEKVASTVNSKHKHLVARVDASLTKRIGQTYKELV